MSVQARNPLRLMNLMARSRILPGFMNFTTSSPRYMNCLPTNKSDIKTSLAYFDPTSVSEKTKLVETTIKDGKGQKFSLEENGFEVVKQINNISAKKNTSADYCKELEEAIAKHLGAATVQIINEPKVTKVENEDIGVLVHSLATSNLFAKVVSADPDKQFLKGRYILFNIWRNIIAETTVTEDDVTPQDDVTENDVAVLDISSVNYPDDVAPTEIAINGIDMHTLLHGNKDNHNWFYFSDMNKDDVLLINHWDSENPFRNCFQSVFHNPEAPPNGPPFEFCNVIAYAFFPVKEPWSIGQ